MTREKTMSDFDWQITTIFEVLGAQLTHDEMTNARLAEVLEINASGVTQRRNGTTPLRIGEPTKIIERYGLNAYGLDHKLFEITDKELFLQELKNHGVGIYEANPRRSLARVLEEAVVETGLSVEIRQARGMRGITYESDNYQVPEVFHVDQRIEIIVRGEPGRHVAIVQRLLGTEYAMETLAPTATLPDTLISAPTMVLPGQFGISLKISKPEGPYRLIAIEGDENLVALFAGQELTKLKEGELSSTPNRPVRITDQIAKSILKKLTDSSPIRCSVKDYFVR